MFSDSIACHQLTFPSILFTATLSFHFPNDQIGERSLNVQVSANGYGHLFATILLVYQQQIQYQIVTVHHIHTRVAVQQFTEFNHPTPLPGKIVYAVHHFGDHIVNALLER